MSAPLRRTNLTLQFQSTGVDFAGPLICRQGGQRRPTKVKSYPCLFILWSTKAVHIKLVSELASEAFLATFCQFTARRGFPSDVYSDNGLNFVRANDNCSKVKTQGPMFFRRSFFISFTPDSHKLPKCGALLGAKCQVIL